MSLLRKPIDRHTMGQLVSARIAELLGDRDTADMWRNQAMARLVGAGHDHASARAAIDRNRVNVEQRAGKELISDGEYLASLGEAAEPVRHIAPCPNPYIHHQRWLADNPHGIALVGLCPLPACGRRIDGPYDHQTQGL